MRKDGGAVSKAPIPLIKIIVAAALVFKLRYFPASIVVHECLAEVPLIVKIYLADVLKFMNIALRIFFMSTGPHCPYLYW